MRCTANIYITLWCQNLNIHHHVHKSSPLVPILSQLEPLYMPPANLPNIHSDPILPSMPQSSEWSPSLGLSPKTPYTFLPSPMHATRPNHLILLDLICLKYFGISTKYEAPHCATSSSLLLLHPLLVLIFSSETWSQIPSVYACPFMRETKFHAHTKQLEELWFCIF
jgi:hypothetical protein